MEYCLGRTQPFPAGKNDLQGVFRRYENKLPGWLYIVAMGTCLVWQRLLWYAKRYGNGGNSFICAVEFGKKKSEIPCSLAVKAATPVQNTLAINWKCIHMASLKRCSSTGGMW